MDTDSPPFERMMQLVSGFWVSRAIHAATELAIADVLADGPQTAAQIAGATQTQPALLYRLLRALASVGIFQEDEQRRFHNTALSETLRSNTSPSLSAFIRMELGDSHHRAWGELLHAIQSGEPAFDKAMGQTAWQFWESNPGKGRLLGEAMNGLTENVVNAVLDVYEFDRFTTVVDVGGGEGGLLGAVLGASPGARGILFDLPYVVESARPRLESQGLIDRCDLVGGDFFSGVPEGGDLYLLKWVLHDWGDEESSAILRNCRKAIREDGVLLVVDTIIPPGNEPSPGKFIDLNMMVLGSGRERTAAEFEDLFSASGFRLRQLVPMRSPSTIIEAIPVND